MDFILEKQNIGAARKLVTPVTNNTRFIMAVRGGREHLWSLFSPLSWLSRLWLMNHYSITAVMEAVMARHHSVMAVGKGIGRLRDGQGL